MEYWISRKNFLNKVFKEIITVFLTDVSIFLNFHIKTDYLAKTNKQTKSQTVFTAKLGGKLSLWMQNYK